MITHIKYYSPLIIFFLLFSCGPSESEIAEQKHQLEEKEKDRNNSITKKNSHKIKII